MIIYRIYHECECGIEKFCCEVMNRLNKTESAVLLYCRFSLFLKDAFFEIVCRVMTFLFQNDFQKILNTIRCNIT